MTDPLDTIQKRLGWINRGLIVGAIVLVLLLIAYTWHRLHAGSAPPQPAAPASHPIAAASPASVAASHPLAAASPAAATSQPAAASASAAAVASAPAVAAASRPVATASAVASASAPEALQPQAPPLAPPTRAAAARAPRHGAAALGAQPRHAAVARATRHAARRPLPAAGATCRRAGWYVQVGAFSQAAGYRRLQQRLAHFGLPTCRGPRKPRGLHELLVGPYASRAEAERLRSHLKAPLRKASFLRHLR